MNFFSKWIFIATVCGAAATEVSGLPQTNTIAPATVQEIIGALGPDGEGLSIPADKIPDIFALTSSRLDEDSKKFIVQGSYSNGRWKGGKAIIEYARDLSYTQVSVYDKGGHRQRIYSVASRSSQPPAPTPAPSPAASTDMNSDQDTTIGTVPVSDETTTEPTPPEATTPSAVTPAPKKKTHHKTTAVPAKRSSSSTVVASAGVSGFIWDESQGSYVPVRTSGFAGSAIVPDENSSTRSLSKTTSSSSASSSTEPEASTPSTKKSKKTKRSTSSEETPTATNSTSSDDTWVPDHLTHTKSSSQKKKPAASTDDSDQSTSPPGTPPGKTTAMANTGYVWDDASGTYVPAGGATSSTTTSTKKSKKKKHSTSATSTTDSSAPSDQSLPATTTSTPNRSSSKTAALTSNSDTSVPSVNTTPDSEYTLRSKPVDNGDSIPSTEELLSQTSPSSSANTETAPPPTAPKTKSQLKAEAKAAAKKKKQDAAAAAQASSDQGTSVTNAPSPSATTAPSQAPDNGSPSADMTPMTSDADQWKPSKNNPRRPADAQLDDTSTSNPATATRTKAQNDALVPSEAGGPDSPGIDSWKPKAGAAPVQDEAGAEAHAVQVAMLPKPEPAAPPPSIDSLLKIAAAGQGNTPNGASDQWAPKSAVLPKADTSIDAEIAAVRNAPKPVPPPVIKLKHDINNPEEGVLPVNSFEKFSGPRYGRHWEYERRLKLEKRPGSPVADYDFYVDEVDRKKEIHNIYYYKHSTGNPIPKLVAVEKHEHVTFLSNYDVDQENKGKVSKFK